MIRDKPLNPQVAVEMMGASLAWETAGHSAQPTPRGTPSVGSTQRHRHRRPAQEDEAGEQAGCLLKVGEIPPILSVSQRLQRTLHCVDLTVQQVAN